MSLVIAYASPREAGRFAARSDALELGVGPARSAATAARRLAQGGISRLFLFGVAGAYREAGLQVGDLCVVTGGLLADEGVDCGGEFLDLAQLGLAVDAASPYDAARAARIADVLGARATRAATVSACSGYDARARTLYTRHGCELETMESAAVAFACSAAGVSLVELRCVSNFCGDRAAGAWDLDRAVRRLESAVHDLLQTEELTR